MRVPAIQSRVQRCLLLLLLLSLFPSLPAQAQSEITLVDGNGNPGVLSELDQDFIRSRIAPLDLASCTSEHLASEPRLDYRRLDVPHDGKVLKLLVSPDVMRNNTLVLYADTADGIVEYTNCDTSRLLPVLALMVTADFERASNDSLLEERILAGHSGLTSYRPTRLMMRRDSHDLSGTYMDFSVSSKHPIFPSAIPINRLYNGLTNKLEQLVPGDEEFFMRLYLAFTGRFSQYIGERASAPVLSRLFSPELFFRFWSSERSWVDAGIGHESNGQRIDTPESLALAEQAYEQSGEPREFARDNLSRGWDYTMLAWQREWNEKLTTQVRLHHYFSSGPFQREIEEYNTWEDQGTRNRPRHQYDGINLELQYNFRRSRCLLGSLPICFSKLQLTQETGYSKPFQNNSTTLELTSDVFGLPIQFWARTGYNSNLVDYYTYSNSWGIGIELLSY